MSRTKTVVFDFDGVINSYISGYTRVDDIPDPPVYGINDEIQKIRKNYFVVVVSTRCSTQSGLNAVKAYLEKHGIEVDCVMATKPPAVCYIDDRAICFTGIASGLAEKVELFQSWCDGMKGREKMDMAINYNQWISVKDRLPEKDGNYLYYRKTPLGSFVNFCYYRATEDKSGRKGFYFLNSDYGDVEVSNVTHWMELPEPPKENESEN